VKTFVSEVDIWCCDT